MLRKDRKQNHIQCLIKITKGRKKWKAKTGTKNKSNKQKRLTNTDINLTI